MRGLEGGQLTAVNHGPLQAPALSSGRLLVFLFPILILGSVTAVMAGVAAFLGWQREIMLMTAAGAGCLMALPTLAVIYRQVADRREAVRALQDVQARVGGIVESAMDAIVTVDELQRVVQFNAAAERVFRWPRAAVVGQRLDMLLPKRFREAHTRHVEQFGHTAVTSRGMGQQAVLRGLRADGTEFPLEASISQHSEHDRKLFTVILRDVTERVSNEELLRRNESRLRGILDSAMDAIITVDERQHIVLFNRAAEAVFLCSREEAVGAPLDWLIPERFRHGHGDLVKQFGAAGSDSRRMGHARVVMGLRRNGEEFPIEASISHLEEQGNRFFTVILRDVSARERAEEALRRSQDEIQSLALAASTVREEEKKRIARELHDELGQSLTALKIDVSWLRENLPGRPPEVDGKLAAMYQLLDSTVAAARRISADLRPLMLDDLGLTAAMEWIVDNFTSRTGIRCTLALGKGDLDLPDPYATTIFRVLQECLTNVAKHAGASHVRVEFNRDAEHAELSVVDDGRGFATEAPRPAGSFGLVGMRERAFLVGGDMTFASTPEGTRARLRLPVRETP